MVVLLQIVCTGHFGTNILSDQWHGIDQLGFRDRFLLCAQTLCATGQADDRAAASSAITEFHTLALDHSIPARHNVTKTRVWTLGSK